MSESRVARGLCDVHDGVELRLRRNSGKGDRWESTGSEKQEGKIM